MNVLHCLLPDGSKVPMRQVRDRRTRRLRLSVSERGVRLSVPWRLPEAVASAFVHEHMGWIASQWRRFQPCLASPVWGFGRFEVLPLAGVERPLAWSEAGRAKLQREGDGLRFLAPLAVSPAMLRRATLKFYADEALAAVDAWLPAYLLGLPRPPSALRLRTLASLWGSLSSQGRVSLDLALVLGPPRVFEYVLVHELCHLLHANHSPAFWREVEARVPDWREARAFLRSDPGLALKARWRAIAVA